MSTYDPNIFDDSEDERLGDARQDTGHLVAWMLPESTLSKLRSYAAAKQQHQFQVVTEAIEHFLSVKKVPRS